MQSKQQFSAGGSEVQLHKPLFVQYWNPSLQLHGKSGSSGLALCMRNSVSPSPDDEANYAGREGRSAMFTYADVQENAAEVVVEGVIDTGVGLTVLVGRAVYAQAALPVPVVIVG